MVPKQDDPVVLRVRQVIAKELDVSLDDVTIEASLQDDLGADSLSLVELMMALEDAFDTEISDEQAKAIRTVGDAVDLVREFQAAQEG